MRYELCVEVAYRKVIKIEAETDKEAEAIAHEIYDDINFVDVIGDVDKEEDAIWSYCLTDRDGSVIDEQDN